MGEPWHTCPYNAFLYPQLWIASVAGGFKMAHVVLLAQLLREASEENEGI